MQHRRKCCCRAAHNSTRLHLQRRRRPESRCPRSRSWMRRRARSFSRRRDVLSATGSTIASTKPPQPGSVRADARPIHAPAPIGEAVSQFLCWARNMRNESCGFSTSEMTQPSGPFTTMELSVTARPLLSKASRTSSVPTTFAIALDDKPVRTPSGRALVAPAREIADAISAEWDAQKEIIDPLTMPFTRFANSVADAVADRVDAVADDIAKYLGSDLLFYRAGHPEALVAREAALWDPVVFWAADTLGAHFILAEGIVHVRQPDPAIAPARAALPADPWSIAALHVVTTLTGSALLALALLRGVLDQDRAWAAAHVDEDWNIEQWGGDEEIAARRAARLVDFRAAAKILKSLNPVIS